MQKIQRFPQGFLGLIGNTSGGTSPASVADQAVGVLNMRHFYDFNAQNRSFFTNTNALNVGVGSVTAFPSAASVADGRNIFVHAFSLQIGLVAAAEAVQIQPVMNFQSTGAIPFGNLLNLSAGQGGVSGVYFDTPIQMRVTDSLGWYVFARTGATATSYGLTVLWSQY